MRWLALPAGIVVLVGTFLDVFRTMVMPRAVRGRYRLTRVLFLAVWRPWRLLALRVKTQQARERVLAGAAPMSLFVLLAAWAALSTVGYGLVLWSPAFVHGVHGSGDGSFTTALYFSGTSLFTIGFGDVVATGLTRAVVIVEGATGLGLVAVVIGYLPVLYQAFNRRESTHLREPTVHDEQPGACFAILAQTSLPEAGACPRPISAGVGAGGRAGAAAWTGPRSTEPAARPP